jgi:Protein of unknown function (DUF3102)
MTTLDELAAAIRAEHDGVICAIRSGIEHAIECGELLNKARAAVRAERGHGHWLAWLKANVPFSESLANKYMKVARARKIIEGKSGTVTDLTLRAALELLTNRKIIPQPPGEFPIIDPDGLRQFSCPRCLYAWKGDPDPCAKHKEVSEHAKTLRMLFTWAERGVITADELRKAQVLAESFQADFYRRARKRIVKEAA